MPLVPPLAVRRSTQLAAAAALVLGLGACSGGDEPDAEPSADGSEGSDAVACTAPEGVTAPSLVVCVTDADGEPAADLPLQATGAGRVVAGRTDDAGKAFFELPARAVGTTYVVTLDPVADPSGAEPAEVEIAENDPTVVELRAG